MALKLIRAVGMSDPYRSCACKDRALEPGEKSAPKVSFASFTRIASLVAMLALVASVSFMFAALSMMNRVTQMALAPTNRILTNRAPDTSEKTLPPEEPAKTTAPTVVFPQCPLVEADLNVAPSLLAALIPETHDPLVLLSRARKLREAGVDMQLVHTELSASAAAAGVFGFPSARIVPLTIDGQNVAFRLAGLQKASAATRAGLENGDVVLSVNGFALDTPEHALTGYQLAQLRKGAVIELLRDGRRLVLDVSWR